MIYPVLLILSVLLIVSGLLIGLSSFTRLSSQAPSYKPSTMQLWMSPSRLRTYFDGNGYRRMVTGGQLIGVGALIYLSTSLLK